MTRLARRKTSAGRGVDFVQLQDTGHQNGSIHLRTTNIPNETAWHVNPGRGERTGRGQENEPPPHFSVASLLLLPKRKQEALPVFQNAALEGRPSVREAALYISQNSNTQG